MDKNPDFSELFEHIGYRFRDEALLRQATTHRSVHGLNKPGESYERLEFLGDSILDFLVTERLYLIFPQESEGNLSKIRGRVVNTRTLASVAVRIGLLPLIRTAASIQKHLTPRKTLADCYEALTAAIYLDGGMDPARRMVDRTLKPVFAEVMKAPERWSQEDPKSRLQTWASQNSQPTPSYEMIKKAARHPSLPILVFRVECVVGEQRFLGMGATKADAQEDAALRAYLELAAIETESDEESDSWD